MSKFLFSSIYVILAFLPYLAIAQPTPAKITGTAGDNTAEIYWEPVEGAQTYQIYRSNQQNQGFTHVHTTSNNIYTDNSVTNNATYYYYVKTYSGTQAGGQSATIKITPQTKGIFAFIRRSDAVFQSIWVAGTNGISSDTLSESEIYMSELNRADFVSLLTTDLKQVIDFSTSPTPQITPDRKWLFFTENKSIKKINLEDNQIKVVVSGNIEAEMGLSVSKDGQKIVYVKKNNNKYSLYLNDIDGQNEEPLLSNSYDNKYPDFSPDNQKVVYVSNQPPGENIFTINLIDKSTSKLTSGFNAKKYPRFSPDGLKIVYQGFDSTSNSYDIFTISNTGANLTNITANSSTNEYFPAWRPDSSKIAYILRNDLIVNNNPQYALHIMIKNADGSGTASYLSKPTNKIIRQGLTWQGKKDAMPPRRIIDLKAVNHDTESITLQFKSPGDDGNVGQAQKYIIVYSETAFSQQGIESPNNNIVYRELTAIPQASGNTETITLTHIKSDTTYYIGVTAIDEESNSSALSNIISRATDDSTDSQPPDPASSLTSIPMDNLKIKLEWNHSPSADTAGYNIYRDNVKIVAAPYQTQYIDTVNQINQSYQYSVKAFDKKLNESVASNISAAVSKDAVAPTAPEWIIANNMEDRVMLKWQKVEIPDLSGYKIYRELNNNTELIAVLPNQISYDDIMGIGQTQYSYSVSAYDKAGNESQKSSNALGIKGIPDNKRILVIVNTNNADSETIAQYYKTARNIPDENIVRLNITNTTNLYIDTYVSQIHTPVQNHILNNNLSDKILYIVTTKGVPLSVTTQSGDIRSLDTMLSKIYSSPSNTNLPSIETIFASPHGYFMVKKRFSADYQMVLTARLDGPSVSLVKSIIDKSASMEKRPDILTKGDMWIDTKNLNADFFDTYYSFADRFIATAVIPAKFKQINYHLDLNSAIFPVNTCYNTQYYYGWYSYNDYREVFSGYLNPGSIAGHLDSASFLSTVNTGSNNWGIHLISRGATVSYGAIAEPYTIAFPCAGIMYDRFYKGFNIAESYWAATNAAQWRMILIGDPLYKPFFYEPENDTLQIISTPPQVKPAGFRIMKALWSTNKITEHAVEYYTGLEPATDTGYAKWFSKDAQIVIPYLEKNQVYYYRVKSKDINGNEQISNTFSFVYQDADNDELEDTWETKHFEGIELFSSIDDPDCDGIINFAEYELGYNPITANNIKLWYSTNTNRVNLSWDSESDRIYRIYFTNAIQPNIIPAFTQAGPYRLGAGQKTSWIDDGVNTQKPSEDKTLNSRFYKITSIPISR